MKAHRWAAEKERGNRLVLTLSVWMARHCPTWLVWITVRVVAGYYFFTSRRARRNIAEYHRRLRETFPQVILPGRFAVFRHFIAFASAIGDRFAVWQGRIGMGDVVIDRDDAMYAKMYDPPANARGQILLCSHLGNVEITRALVERFSRFRLTVLVHTRHAQFFSAALAKAGASDLRLLQVGALDAASMLRLCERLDDGEWVAIAADRTPLYGERQERIRFLGKETAFAQGPWLLSGLLQAPVNTLFCLKEAGRYHLYFDHFCAPLHWNRENRRHVVRAHMQRYARVLERFCAKAPLQWFNFYDFWQEEEDDA